MEKHVLPVLLASFLMTATLTGYADEVQRYGSAMNDSIEKQRDDSPVDNHAQVSNTDEQQCLDSRPSKEQQSYGSKVGHKALNGFANMTTAVLEIPKNIINVTNDSNIFFGLVAGLAKGLINIGGRVGVGVADFITALLPTKPIAYPVYIWDDFDVDTSYSAVFRLQEKNNCIH